MTLIPFLLHDDRSTKGPAGKKGGKVIIGKTGSPLFRRFENIRPLRTPKLFESPHLRRDRSPRAPEQRTVDFDMAVVIDETHLSKFIHKMTDALVVPIISASISWLIFVRLPMPLRDLLCILEATDKPSNRLWINHLRWRADTRSIFRCWLQGPRAEAPYSLFGADMIGEMFMAENEKVRQRAEAMAADAKSRLSDAGVTGNVEVCLDAFQDTLARIRRMALCSDLTVMNRPGGAAERREILFEEVLFSAGRTVLLPSSAATEGFAKIAVAWDGSSHAARALSQALHLFDGIKEAEVLVVEGEKDLRGIAPAKNVAAHIGRHGVTARVVELKAEGDGVGSTIDKHAATAGVDLVVMGAFGRSRLREFVLGGVTPEADASVEQAASAGALRRGFSLFRPSGVRPGRLQAASASQSPRACHRRA